MGAARTVVDLMAERIDIAQVVADHFRRLGPHIPPDALGTARAVDDAFFTIPRSEITDCNYEYSIPQDMAEDDPVVEGYHAHVMNDALLDAYSKGLMPVEIPRRHRLPPDPHRYPFMVRFCLTCRARRVA